MTDHFKMFACGSFCKGQVHFSLIESLVRSKQPARAQGQIFCLETGYPVFNAEGGQWIEGELLDLEISSIQAKILDEFHGFTPMAPEKCLFHKYQVVCRVEGQTEPIKALAYSANLAKLPKAASRLEDGNWRELLKTRSTLMDRLTEGQRTYIQKLGRSTGREVVPINLNLYRELMSLELIVDKGRRLALSKLGKEVYRYLPGASGQ